MASDWLVVVPAKRLSRAKTRLEPWCPLHRSDLALAMTRDVLSTALSVSAVGDVVVLTEDPDVTDMAERLGADVAVDAGLGGLNASLAAFLDRVPPGRPTAVLVGDLPAARPEHLSAALTLAESSLSAFVADQNGSGTTMLAGTRPRALRPRFGVGSAALHESGGASPLSVEDSLRRDVDCGEDLMLASALGLGDASRRVVERHLEQHADHRPVRRIRAERPLTAGSAR